MYFFLCFIVSYIWILNCLSRLLLPVYHILAVLFISFVFIKHWFVIIIINTDYLKSNKWIIFNIHLFLVIGYLLLLLSCNPDLRNTNLRDSSIFRNKSQLPDFHWSTVASRNSGPCNSGISRYSGQILQTNCLF